MSSFVCSHCSLNLNAADVLPGSHATCPRCGEEVPLGATISAATVPGNASPATVDYHESKPGLEASPQESDRKSAPPGYDELGLLGRGGMGVVYKARHRSLDRVVALKMILTRGHAADDELARFQAEAQAVARLQHPNIVQVFDHGIHDAKPYLALEYCEGGSLASRLDGTPLAPEIAAALVEKLASAVAAAHQASIIHRDLKPSNVLLAGDSSLANAVPKIADFGLAKKLDEDSEQTRSGTILGTPSYMAPEQALGESKHVGPAADIYALGAILYELLTGRPPFKAATTLETLEMVRTQEPVAPRQLQPKTPRDLETICLKCLHKEPNRRYTSATAVAEDLRRFQQQEPILARPISRMERLAKWARRRPAIAGLLALSFLLAVGGLSGILWAYGQALAERDSALKAEAKAEERLYLSNVNLARSEWLAGNVEQAEQLLQACPPELRGMEWNYLARLCRPEQRSFDLEGFGWQIAYSQDGTRFAMTGDKTVAVWDVTREKFVWRHSTGEVPSHGVALSPKGDIVAACFGDGQYPDHGGEVKVWKVDTGELLHHIKEPEHGFWSVAFRKVGETGLDLAAFGGSPRAERPDKEKGQLIVWNMATGQEKWQRRTYINPGHPNAKIVFSPDGKYLVVAAHYLMIVDAETSKYVGDVEPSRFRVVSVAFDKKGTRLAAIGTDSFHLGQVSDWTKSKKQLPFFESHRCVAFSPNGELAWAGADNTIYLWEDGSSKPPRILRGHRGWVMSIAFRPDGKQLASISADGTAKLWDLSQPTQEYATITGKVAALTHDDKLVVGKQQQLSLHEPDGTLIKELTTFPQSVSTLECSRDGKWLAIGGGEGLVATYDLVQNRKLREWTVRKAEILRLRFDRSGQRLAAADRDGGIHVWDTQTGEQVSGAWKGVPIDSSPLGQHSLTLALHPDGDLLAFIGATQRNSVTWAFWDISTGKYKGGRTVPRGSCAFSPDGKHLALGNKGDIEIWRLDRSQPWDPDGQPQQIFKGHSYHLVDLRYSPDGRRLASFAQDYSLRLWDTKSGQSTLRLHPFFGDVRSQICFSPSRHNLAVNYVRTMGETARRIRVLDARPLPQKGSHE